VGSTSFLRHFWAHIHFGDSWHSHDFGGQAQCSAVIPCHMCCNPDFINVARKTRRVPRIPCEIRQRCHSSHDLRDIAIRTLLILLFAHLSLVNDGIAPRASTNQPQRYEQQQCQPLNACKLVELRKKSFSYRIRPMRLRGGDSSAAVASGRGSKTDSLGKASGMFSWLPITRLLQGRRRFENLTRDEKTADDAQSFQKDGMENGNNAQYSENTPRHTISTPSGAQMATEHAMDPLHTKSQGNTPPLHAKDANPHPLSSQPHTKRSQPALGQKQHHHHEENHDALEFHDYSDGTNKFGNRSVAVSVCTPTLALPEHEYPVEEPKPSLMDDNSEYGHHHRGRDHHPALPRGECQACGKTWGTRYGLARNSDGEWVKHICAQCARYEQEQPTGPWAVLVLSKRCIRCKRIATHGSKDPKQQQQTQSQTSLQQELAGSLVVTMKRRAIHCSVHKREGEVYLISRKCREEGCLKIPVFGAQGTRVPVTCSAHKMPGEIDVKVRMHDAIHASIHVSMNKAMTTGPCNLLIK
jgi:hypothetical protein